MEQVKVGGETSAYCTSCKAMRHHVVVAMTGAVPAKVECLSCHKQHRYKGHMPGEKPAKASVKKAAGGPTTPRRTSKSSGDPAIPAVNPLDALLASRSGAPTRGYSPTERYAVGELLSHPSFGVGAVTSTPSPGKMAVLFRDSTRLLLHERPSAAGGAPKLQPPPRREDGPRGVSDAPPKTKPVL